MRLFASGALCACVVLCCVSPVFARTLHVAPKGDDAGRGSADAPLRTVGRAYNLARPGDTIRLAPGRYCETVRPPRDGKPGAPITLVGDPSGEAILCGADEAPKLRALTPAERARFPKPEKLLCAELTGWREVPRLAFVIGGDGKTRKLTLARWPNWRVKTKWKRTETWRVIHGENAGGHVILDPEGLTQPAGFWDKAWVWTTLSGAPDHWLVCRRVKSYDPKLGRIVFDRRPKKGKVAVERSRYYLEGIPAILDEPGEWWFDEAARKFYFWPPEGASPGKLRLFVSRRGRVLDIESRHGLDFRDVTFEFCNRANMSSSHRTGMDYGTVYIHGDCSRLSFTGCRVRWGSNGLMIRVMRAGGVISDLSFRKGSVTDMEGSFLVAHAYWYRLPRGNPGGGVIRRLWIEDNRFDGAGFRGGTGITINGIHLNSVRDCVIRRNTIRNVQKVGVFPVNRLPRPVRVNIAICGNVITDTGLGNADVGPFMCYDYQPGCFIFRNRIRGCRGYSPAREHAATRFNYYKPANFGHGLYNDHGENYVWHHNVCEDLGDWGVLVNGGSGVKYYNNTLVRASRGMRPSKLRVNPTPDGRRLPFAPLRLVNNLFAEITVLHCMPFPKYINRIRSDFNLFDRSPKYFAYHKGYISHKDYRLYFERTGLEEHSLSADPAFVDSAKGDFRLQPKSPAIDAGTFLTRTTRAGEGRDIPVEDADWFCDGFGMIEGDRIQVEGNPAVRVERIDYARHVITVARPLKWPKGAGVAAPYAGKAPDIGALEWGL